MNLVWPYFLGTAHFGRRSEEGRNIGGGVILVHGSQVWPNKQHNFRVILTK